MSRDLDIVTIGGDEHDDIMCDAERYRFLRRHFGIIRGPSGMAEFCAINLPRPAYIAPDPAAELDASIDAELRQR